MKQIFLGGCERSGTTLLASLLGGHSKCLTIPESQFKIDVLRPYGLPTDESELRDAALRTLHNWRFRAWGVNIELSEIPWKSFDRSYAKFYEWLVSQYGRSVENSHYECWIDQTPENVKNLSTFFELFPEAKAIHIIRDGRAVTASVLPLDWGPSTALHSALDWAQKVLTGICAEAAYGPDRVYRIYYETLVKQPEESLRELCEWLGLEFESRMLANEGYRKPDYYNYKAHKLVGMRTDRNRATAWQSNLSEQQLGIFESHTGELLSYLGYQPVLGLKAPRVTGSDIVMSGIRELWGECMNRIRGLIRIRKTVR